MKAKEIKPGIMFLRKDNPNETLIMLDKKQYPANDCLLCINLNQPEALFGVLENDEVFA